MELFDFERVGVYHRRGESAVGSPWEILASIWHLTQLIMEDSEAGLAELDLHPKAFFLMVCVDRWPFPAELARVLCMPPPTVTYVIKQLEEKRYIQRKPEPGDLRKFRLALTPLGKKALKASQAKVNRAFGARLERLTPAESAEFGRVIARLAETPTEPRTGSTDPDRSEG